MIRFLIIVALFVAGSAGAEQIAPDLKVAFFGDQGLSPRSKAVLRLVKAEGAHMVHGAYIEAYGAPLTVI